MLESNLPAAASADEVRTEIAAAIAAGATRWAADESAPRQVRRRPRRQDRQRVGQGSAREEVACASRANGSAEQSGIGYHKPRLSASISRAESLSIDSNL